MLVALFLDALQLLGFDYIAMNFWFALLSHLPK